METNSLTGSQPKTDEEYKQEISRMIPEIEAMLQNAAHTTEEARKIGKRNRRLIAHLEEQLSCGKL